MSGDRGPRGIHGARGARGARGACRLLLVGGGACCLAALPASLAAQATAPRGKAVYDRWCAGCHGDTGRGDGAGATTMLPRPRDFTRGVYKIRTTASGAIPTDADILHVVDEGMPGTAMPGWRERLSEEERREVAAYLKSFSTFFSQPASAVAIGDAPDGGERAVADGRAAYRTLECFKCHGQAGRGDGPSAPTLQDDWDHPIRAANLTTRWAFRGGGTVEAIYTRLRTGLDGTPMPSYADAIEQRLITDEQLWHVAAYVASLSPETPRVREVIRARLVPALPSSPDDTAWSGVEPSWIPTVGQIVVKPRWFAPTVSGVWVQAVHDGRRLALRLAWTDPSRSPHPAWDEWIGRMAATMTGVDGPISTRQGADRVVLQWAPRPDDAERPYFLGGSARRPVHAWRWTSAPDRVEVGSARGLGTFTAAAGAAGAAGAAAAGADGGDGGARRANAGVTHAARFADGEWRLQLVRDLRPADTTGAPTFTPGRAVPLALFVADGSNGEDDVRGAVSTWYAVHLDVPTPARVYAAPAATVILTAGLGLLLVVRAQRREREAGPSQPEDGR